MQRIHINPTHTRTQEDPEGRRRNLKLRTYAVVCLNEECGILEWVNNTSCVRHLISEAHSYWPRDYPTVSTKEIFHPFVEMQTKQVDNLEELVAQYVCVFGCVCVYLSDCLFVYQPNPN